MGAGEWEDATFLPASRITKQGRQGVLASEGQERPRKHTHTDICLPCLSEKRTTHPTLHRLANAENDCSPPEPPPDMRRTLSLRTGRARTHRHTHRHINVNANTLASGVAGARTHMLTQARTHLRVPSRALYSPLKLISPWTQQEVGRGGGRDGCAHEDRGIVVPTLCTHPQSSCTGTGTGTGNREQGTENREQGPGNREQAHTS